MVQTKEIMAEQPLFEEEAKKEIKVESRTRQPEFKVELNPRYYEEAMTLKKAKILNMAKYGDLYRF